MPPPCIAASPWRRRGKLFGIERVVGTLGGRRGPFLLQDADAITDNVVSAEWFVAPGSDSGKAARLRGIDGPASIWAKAP
jgi:hypothetical protein